MNSTEQSAVAAPVGPTVRSQHTEWAEIRTALSRRYGHLYSVSSRKDVSSKEVSYVDYSKHAYVGRACTLLLKAEQQETAARNVIKAFEALGHAKDTASLLQAHAHCENTMTALKDVLGPNCRTENDDAK